MTQENASQEKTSQEKAHPEDTPGRTENADSSPEKKAVENYVDVKDTVFRRVDSELILDFKLANNFAEQGSAEGYVHIIAMDENKECPSEWNYGNTKPTEHIEPKAPLDAAAG